MRGKGWLRWACGSLAFVFVAAAVGIELGDPAPPLKVKEWVKGGPVDLAKGKGKNVYVVEFWATWCPPCRTSIPHLTELQKKYKDKNVVVIGISSSDKDVDKVKAFVESMGDKMGYVVAYEDRLESPTADAYMKAFHQNGIPTAFIVDKQGRIAWIGHPMTIDTPLEQVVAGTFDLEASKKEFKKQQEEVRLQRDLNKPIGEYMEFAKAGDEEEAKKRGAEILSKIEEYPNLLNAFSWIILTAPGLEFRDTALALKGAEKANALTKGEDFSVLDTYARALWANGKKEEAIQQQEKALELAPEGRAKEAMQKSLDAYKAGEDPPTK